MSFEQYTSNLLQCQTGGEADPSEGNERIHAVNDNGFLSLHLHGQSEVTSNSLPSISDLVLSQDGSHELPICCLDYMTVDFTDDAIWYECGNCNHVAVLHSND